MPILLIVLMLCLLLRAPLTMDAASAACRLFVTAVLPGLFPYMVLSLMLLSRVKRLSPGWLMLLGWGGGSPTGARLIPLCPGLSARARWRLLITCGTMSPMFLLGTLGGWLNSSVAGLVCLVSVIAGGYLAGWASSGCGGLDAPVQTAPSRPLSFGAAVEQSARTMLLVCGTMVMLRVFAALAGRVLPTVAVLPVTTLLEVTTGAQAIAVLPWPLAWRTALLSGAAGFGGLAILLQNRAVLGENVPHGALHLLFQGLHGAISFLIALGLMCLIG